jgi:hypothetical protein
MDDATKLLLEAYARAGIAEGDSLKIHAEKLLKHLSPTIQEIERTADTLVVEITSSVDASLFDGITCGNRHLKAYTYPDGKMSGLTRIGHCDHAVSSLYEGAILTEISKVRLTRIVHPGDTVRITIKKIGVEQTKFGKQIVSSLEGCLVMSGKEIFEPCQVFIL